MAVSAFVSVGKYGPNFSATYVLCSWVVLVCAETTEGTSKAVPIVIADRTAATDFEFIDDPFGIVRPEPRARAGAPRSARETIVLSVGNLRCHRSVVCHAAARAEVREHSSRVIRWCGHLMDLLDAAQRVGVRPGRRRPAMAVR